MPEPLQIRTFTSTGFGENAYLVRCTETGAAVVIDPGSQVDEILQALERDSISIQAILLTHAHLDHIEGVAELKRRTDAPVWLHPADRPLYDRAPEQGAAFGVRMEAPPAPDEAWAPPQTYALGACEFEVRHAPGHAPGHVILYAADAAAAFVGDVVFAGSIGRTDLPGGDYAQLMKSIREQVLSLPDETRIYPGHGPVSTVGQERVGNPFLAPQFGGRLA